MVKVGYLALAIRSSYNLIGKVKTYQKEVAAAKIMARKILRWRREHI
jgi:hypothetical protein